MSLMRHARLLNNFHGNHHPAINNTLLSSYIFAAPARHFSRYPGGSIGFENQDLGKLASRKHLQKQQWQPDVKLSVEDQEGLDVESNPVLQEFSHDVGDPANAEMVDLLGRAYTFKIYHDETHTPAMAQRS